MNIEVLPDTNAVAKRAAAMIAEHARLAFAARGRFLLAMSAGRSARTVLRMLGKEEVPWGGVHIIQVHEELPPIDSKSTLAGLREVLLEDTPIHPRQIYSMPGTACKLSNGLRRYVRTLESLAGSPAVLDLVHLDLTADAYMASVLVGNPLSRECGQDVAIRELQCGQRQIVLTYRIINRSRQILWIATGKEGVRALFQLESASPSMPTFSLLTDRTLILADWAAARVTGQKHAVM